MESRLGTAPEPFTDSAPKPVSERAIPGIIFATVLLSASVVIAQETSPINSDTPKIRNRLLEEVVVTAQKREENIQDVPISIQAFSGDLLAAKGINDPIDLPTITPGMTYSAITGFTLVYIRGVGSDVFLPNGEASVATYVDGVYFPLNAGLAQSFGSIERLEILKGPQGTLFGRNTTGGAINVTTKSPTEEFTAELSGSYARFEDIRFSANVGGPITESLMANIGIIANRSENYYKNEGPPIEGKLEDAKEDGLRAKLLWMPTDELEILLTYYALSSETSKFNMTVAEAKPAGATAGVAPASSPYHDHTDAPQYSTTDVSVGILNIEYDLGWATFKSISGWQDTQYFTLTDFDGSNMPIAAFDGTAILKSFSQEIQLLSTDAPEWLEWIVGAYYMDVSEASFNPQLAPFSTDSIYVSIPPLGDALSDLDLIPQSTLQMFGLMKTKSTSVFGQATWAMTDTLSLTLGGRYQEEERAISETSSVMEFDDDPQSQTICCNPSSFSEEETNFSPKATLDYAPNDSLLIYTTWAKGYKSGTFNLVNILVPSNYVHPEVVTSYEFGVKSELFDSAVRLNAAIFHNEVQNSQQQFISLFSGGITQLENAGGLEIEGAEFDLTWHITDQLAFNAGAAYLDGVYTDFKNASGYEPGTGTYTNTLDLTGNSTVRTPEWSANASLSYTFAVPGGTLESVVDGYYNSGYFYDTQNVAEQPEYYLINARFSYFHEDTGIRFTVFGKNLNDELYYYNRYQTDFGTLGTVAPPMSAGAKLEWAY
ncbi:TonB-dependent receptor [Spongiibacter sp. KMU-166]|uniref:TonB-dependent receptor n=1 Tax=Spongiibacter thalassae TaxID=2721624 RepID=A0ABX1GA57_9GAMM|nr:TonB-dependent receptor [Spongiibacter thalassae]NKI16041.1 TonB-dependent receptor [Spongiibacter thalassae]